MNLLVCDTLLVSLLQQILTGGTEPTLFHWSVNGEKEAEIPVSPKSVFSLAVNKNSKSNKVRYSNFNFFNFIIYFAFLLTLYFVISNVTWLELNLYKLEVLLALFYRLVSRGIFAPPPPAVDGDANGKGCNEAADKAETFLPCTMSYCIRHNFKCGISMLKENTYTDTEKSI